MTDLTDLLAYIRARAEKVPAKGESAFVGMALPVPATTELWNLREITRTDVPRLLAALEGVVALHKPVEVYEIDPANGTWIYDGDERRIMATLCRECTPDFVLEDIDESDYEGPYDVDVSHPCPTVAAVVAALGEEEKPFTGFPPTSLRKNKVG